MYGILMYYISCFLWGGGIWLQTQLFVYLYWWFLHRSLQGPLFIMRISLSPPSQLLLSSDQATVLEREKGACVLSEVKNVIREACN